jgi:hypothetical protein
MGRCWFDVRGRDAESDGRISSTIPQPSSCSSMVSEYVSWLSAADLGETCTPVSVESSSSEDKEDSSEL